MGPAPLKILLMVSLPAFVVGVPLLIGAIVFGMWLRRTNRTTASKPFLGVVICGAVSFLCMCGAVSSLALGSVRDRYADHNPLWPVIMIGLLLLALATAFIAALFAVWMVWRMLAARPLSSGATAAGTAPARSAG